MLILRRIYCGFCCTVICGAVLYVASNTVLGFLDRLETGNWPTTGEHGPENKDWQYLQEADQ